MAGYTQAELMTIFETSGISSIDAQRRLAQAIINAYVDIGVIRVVETTGGAGAPMYNYNTRKYFSAMSRPLIELATACYGQNYTSAQIIALAQTEAYGPLSYSFATYAPNIIQSIYACMEGAQTLADGTFLNVVNRWGETGQCVDTGGSIAYTHGGTNAGTETQTAVQRAAAIVALEDVVAAVASTWYVFDFEVTAAPATPGNLSKYAITTAFALAATNIAPLTTAGIGSTGKKSLIFYSAAAPVDLVFDIASTGAATTTITNLSLKRLVSNDIASTYRAFSTNPLSNFTETQAQYYGSLGSNYCKKFIAGIVTSTLQKMAEGEFGVYGTINKKAEPVLDTWTT